MTSWKITQMCRSIMLVVIYSSFFYNALLISITRSDCGAGIGRASKNFLLKFFEKVDLVDQNSKFLDEARDSYLKDEVASGKVQELIPIGLQEFNPAIGRYDMIWIQWVLVHLMDDDIIALLKRCRDALTTNGVIGVKENVSQRGVAETHDHSITRPPNELESIFEQAGLQVTKRIVITEPREYYPVHMYIL
ncbi:hypothetical protein BCR33DRAFT_714648, partial [Rhizoclosmatium globosum]